MIKMFKYDYMSNDQWLVGNLGSYVLAKVTNDSVLSKVEYKSYEEPLPATQTKKATSFHKKQFCLLKALLTN